MSKKYVEYETPNQFYNLIESSTKMAESWYQECHYCGMRDGLCTTLHNVQNLTQVDVCRWCLELEGVNNHISKYDHSGDFAAIWTIKVLTLIVMFHVLAKFYFW